jgi:hypothetical protein
MTTYTTPNVSSGLTDRGVRDVSGTEQINDNGAARDLRDLRGPVPDDRREPSLAAARGPVDVAGVRTAEWSPGGTRGVPKAAIGVVGAALVGGVALALVLIGPGDKVVKPASQAVAMAPASQGPAASAATADPTVDNAVAQLDQQPTAAGPAAAAAPADTAAQDDASTQATPAPAPAPAAAKAPNAEAPAPAPRATTHRSTATRTPADDAANRQPVATPSTDAQQPSSQAPAMQQTPAAPTVTPDTPSTPAPDQGATPAPAPSQDGQ